MKFTIEAKTLAQTLQRVSEACERRNTIPILGNVLIECRDGQSYFTATDLDLQVKERVQVESATDGVTTAAAQMLKDLVGKADAGALVTLELKDNYLHVKAGGFKTKLNTLPPEDFPRLASDDFAAQFTIPAKNLKNAIDKTIWAASTEQTRYYLNGIAMQNIEGKATFIATDGHRLSRYIADDADQFADVIIPTKTAKQWKTAIGDADCDAVVSVSETKTRIVVGNIEVLSKGIDGTFPQWQRVVPIGHPNKVTGQSVELSKAIDRVATIATERTKAVKLILAGNEATVTVVDSVNGTATDVVDVVQEGEDVEIGINSKYGLTALAQADKGEVTIAYKGHMDQIVVTYEKEPTLLCVVMPQRL